MIILYVFLQFGFIDGCLARLRFGDTRGAAGFALRLARFFARRLGGVARVELRPAGVAAGDAQGAAEFAVGHPGGVADGKGVGMGSRVKPGMTT